MTVPKRRPWRLNRLRARRIQVSGGPQQPEEERKKTSSLWWSTVCEIFTEYTTNCSLHGLRYVGARHSTPVERVFWAVAFLTSLASVLFIMTLVWERWERTPVMVSFKNSVTPIWDVPFPAVTVCNENQVNLSLMSLKVLSDEQQVVSHEYMENFSYAAILCPYLNYNYLYQMNETRLKEFILEASPSCERMIADYQWMEEDKPACDHFRPSLTVTGLCHTFNMLPLHQILRSGVSLGLNMSSQYEDTTYDWHPDTQFNVTAGFQTRPKRAMGGGIGYGVKLSLLQDTEEINHRCSGPHSGFVVTLHSPAEVPRVDKSFTRVSLNTEVVFTVTPKVIYTETKLLKIPPAKRACYFSTEKQLHFFRLYTQRNCRLECLTNYTLQECRCVWFYMPHHRNTPICPKQRQECVELVRRTVKKAEMTRAEIKLWPNSTSGIRSCQCLPSCVELSYDGETSASIQDWSGYYKEMGSPKNRTTQTRIIIFFKSDQFIGIYRSELFGIVDFISNCGGLLSLFLGFGLLSIVEIFYFLTIRPIFGKLPRRPEPQVYHHHHRHLPNPADKKAVNQWRTVTY